MAKTISENMKEYRKNTMGYDKSHWIYFININEDESIGLFEGDCFAVSESYGETEERQLTCRVVPDATGLAPDKYRGSDGKLYVKTKEAFLKALFDFIYSDNRDFCPTHIYCEAEQYDFVQSIHELITQMYGRTEPKTDRFSKQWTGKKTLIMPFNAITQMFFSEDINAKTICEKSSNGSYYSGNGYGFNGGFVPCESLNMYKLWLSIRVCINKDACFGDIKYANEAYIKASYKFTHDIEEEEKEKQAIVEENKSIPSNRISNFIINIIHQVNRICDEIDNK